MGLQVLPTTLTIAQYCQGIYPSNLSHLGFSSDRKVARISLQVIICFLSTPLWNTTLSHVCFWTRCLTPLVFLRTVFVIADDITHINHNSCYQCVDMSCSVSQEWERECAAGGGRHPLLSCRPVREEAAVSGGA